MVETSTVVDTALTLAVQDSVLASVVVPYHMVLPSMVVLDIVLASVADQIVAQELVHTYLCKYTCDMII